MTRRIGRPIRRRLQTRCEGRAMRVDAATLSRPDLDFLAWMGLLTAQPSDKIRGHMSTLLLIPLEDTVVFPTMDVTLPVDVGDEERVLLVPRHEGDYAKVGTIARVADKIRLPGGIRGAALEGASRGLLGAAETDTDARLWIEVHERVDDVPVDGRTRDLERSYRAVV